MNENNLNIKGNEFIQTKNRLNSRYFVDANKLIDNLNAVSPSFCLAKWFNVSIHIPTGQTHSCYHPPSHRIPVNEIKINVSALHNTKYKKEQRKKMLEGTRPSECNFCWQIEDSGSQLSDRAYRSKDIYQEGLIEEALSLGWKHDAKPKYLEVNFNQACNFKCRYCSPHLSTAWMKEIEKNGPYVLNDRHHNDLSWMKDQNVWPDNSPNNLYLQAFWKWFPDIYHNLHTFRMTGGEPLMDKNTFKIFDHVKNNPKSDLHLSITSNCCPPSDQWNKFMSSLVEITENNSIDHFMLFCSLDSWGKQAEYIRTGLNFEVMLSNVKEYLSKGSKHSLTFICTFNVLSYTNWINYLKNILELRKQFNTNRQLIWFDMPQLHYPEWLNPKILPEMVNILEKSLIFMNQNLETEQNKFKGFKDFEISKVQRLIDWIKSPADFELTIAKKNFYMFIMESDKRNNTKFSNIFPELENFLNDCKQII